jgi:hypothetical protein
MNTFPSHSALGSSVCLKQSNRVVSPLFFVEGEGRIFPATSFYNPIPATMVIVFALTPRTPRATKGLGNPLRQTQPTQQDQTEEKNDDLEKD